MSLLLASFGSGFRPRARDAGSPTPQVHPHAFPRPPDDGECLLIEDGGDENQAIAALLHDAIKDAGGPLALSHICNAFGDEVAALVDEVSEADANPKPPWRERKECYLTHLESVSMGAMRIAAADKLHNLRTLLGDLRRPGPLFWPISTLLPSSRSDSSPSALKCYLATITPVSICMSTRPCSSSWKLRSPHPH